jgi:hypothetical protein
MQVHDRTYVRVVFYTFYRFQEALLLYEHSESSSASGTDPSGIDVAYENVTELMMRF